MSYKSIFYISILSLLLFICANAVPEAARAESPQDTAQDAVRDRKTSPDKSDSPIAGSIKPEDAEIKDLKERIIEIRNKGKLGFSKIVICSSVDGYGMYTPLKPNQKTGRIWIYLEPANVSTLISEDRYVIDCRLDLLVVDSRGKVLARKKNLNVGKISRSPMMDLFFRLGLTLKKKLRRSIRIKVMLHDKTKGESAAANLRINVKPRNGRVLKDV